ncbi:MAG: dihydrolipoamide acetyltransferase, partial [Proteobacteria bacterium]
MATEIKMPQLSDTMNSGKILAWRKKEGDQVKRGEILAEVETDKANLEIECFQPGTLLMVLVPAGSTANVGEAICVMGNPGENVAADRKPAPQAPAKSEDPPAPSRETVSTPPHSSPTPPDNRVQHEPAPEETHGSSRLRISPLARRLAAEQGLDPAKLHGTG